MDKRELVLDVLSTLSGSEPGQIEMDMDLVADLGIDSPKALQLLVEIEDRSGVEIPDEAAAAMETVGDLLQFLDSR